MQRVVTTENGERVVKTVPVPEPEDQEGGENRPGSFEFLFAAFGGGIAPLPELEEGGLGL